MPASALKLPFSAGFRLFFLLAPLAAVAVMARTGMILAGSGEPPAGNPFAWHGHEMLFGYVAAAMAGFVLTAVPNWTKTEPVQGLPLAMLGVLWLIARVGLWDGHSDWWGMAADIAFLPAAALLAARPLVGRGTPRLWLPITVILVVAGANALWHAAGLLGQPWLSSRALAFATMVIATLIAVIGGRITPNFTRNRLNTRGRGPLPRETDWRDGLAIGASALVAVAELIGPTAAAVLAIPAAILHAVRLWGWRGSRVVNEPLLFALHVGYGWLAAGYAIRAAALFDPSLTDTWALHGLLVGAIGTMTLTVMSRATLGHTGRAFHAGVLLTLALVLMQAAALVRLFAAWTGPDAWSVAGMLWSGAFVLFLIRCGPMLMRPRVDGGANGAVLQR